MTLTELLNLLDQTKYPIAYSHFNEAPSIPYITYTTPSNPDFKADNKNYHEIIDVDIELYTTKKDVQAEQSIETILKENEIPYNAYQIHIETENLFQKTYEVRLI